jgi:hypothetical protein
LCKPLFLKVFKKSDCRGLNDVGNALNEPVFDYGKYRWERREIVPGEHFDEVPREFGERQIEWGGASSLHSSRKARHLPSKDGQAVSISGIISDLVITVAPAWPVLSYEIKSRPPNSATGSTSRPVGAHHSVDPPTIRIGGSVQPA